MMKKKVKDLVIRFILVGIIVVSIIIIAVTIVKQTQYYKDKELANTARQLRIEALEYVVQEDQNTISEKCDEIHRLEEENRQLRILSKLKDCGVCGSHDIEYIDREDSISISCNKCYTHVDFEKIYLVSENKIHDTWNGLRFKVLNELE